MTLAEKQSALLGELGQFKNSQDRFAYVVHRGRQASGASDALRSDAYRIEGCLAKLWLKPEFKDGKCWFSTDSDSAIVKGIAVILCSFYSGHTPEEIVTTDPSFLETVGINQHLTQNRRHSLSKVWDQIKAFAQSQQVRN